MAGGVLYNKDIYEELGLEVPTTWDEFIANSEKIKAAGRPPRSSRPTATPGRRQLFVLGDFYNVSRRRTRTGPSEYTDERGASTSTSRRSQGFAHLQEASRGRLVQRGLRVGARTTTASGWSPPATARSTRCSPFAVSAIAAELPRRRRRRRHLPAARPGRRRQRPDGLDAERGLHPQDHRGRQARGGQEVRRVRRDARRAATSRSTAIGAERSVRRSTAARCPTTCPAWSADLQPYFDEGKTNLALEFLSPIKGPTLEQITVAVGSGITVGRGRRRAVRRGRQEAGAAARPRGLVRTRTHRQPAGAGGHGRGPAHRHQRGAPMTTHSRAAAAPTACRHRARQAASAGA